MRSDNTAPVIDTENHDGEEWRQVPWAELYEVSNHGRVRSHARPGEPRLLRPTPNNRGSMIIVIRRTESLKATCETVARLVAGAFGELPPRSIVRHRDKNLRNNRLENLEIVSRDIADPSILV